MEVDYAETYNPQKILDDPLFKILKEGEEPEAGANLAVFYNQKEIHLVRKPRPKASPGQVLVHVRATGICGRNPLAMHAGLGGTTAVRRWCSSPHLPIMASTLTRWHLHPAKWLHKLPDNVSFEEGALCEPLAVALAGIERSDLRLGDPVLICGAGPIGLVSLLSARAAGAEPVVITDLVQSRLDFAKTLVPRVHTVLIDRNRSPQEQAAIIREAAAGPVTLVLECTGFESSVQTGIFATKFGGKVFVIGVGQSEQSFPFMHLSANEIDLRFQYRYCNQYPKAIRLVAGGLINLKPLVTHRFTLENAISAFHVAADPTQGSIKVQILD